MSGHRRPDPVSHLPRCVCGKLIHPSARSARRAIRENAAKGRVLYAYRCPETGEMHLTKQAQWDTRRNSTEAQLAEERRSQ